MSKKLMLVFTLVITLALIPMSISFAASKIPVDASEFNGNYYYVFNKLSTWQDANKNCKALGGHMVVITSEEEQTFITELLGNSAEEYWLGATKKDDKFSWVTGEKWEYTNWKLSWPSYYDYWDALILTNEGWIDYFSDNSKKNVSGYICEWEMDDYSVSLPSKASILSIKKVSKNTKNISWKEMKDVEGYSIYMKTEPNGIYQKIAETNEADISTYNVENLNKGETYYFRVRAYKSIYGEKSYGEPSVPKKLKLN